MAVSLDALTKRLLGDIPGLPLNRAQQCVADGWRDICESRLWSFNLGEIDLACPGIISDGTCTVIPFSATVVGDSTAATAWAALHAVYPLTTLQFRVNLGEVFSITAYNGTNTITLDRVWQPNAYPAATLTGQAYQILKNLYWVDPSDGSTFLCWESIVDPINGYRFRKTRLCTADLDRFDPYRNAYSNPVYAASFEPNSNGNMKFEFWPLPQAAQPYVAVYRTNGKPLVAPGDTIPATVSRNLVELRAEVLAYKWAASNIGQVPAGNKIDWMALMQASQAGYEDELVRFSRQDDERILSYLVKYSPMAGPGIMTGSFLQMHDGLGILFGWPGD